MVPGRGSSSGRRLQRSRPGEVHGVERGGVVVAGDRLQRLGDPLQVGAQQCAQHLAALGVQVGRRHAGRGARQRDGLLLRVGERGPLLDGLAHVVERTLLLGVGERPGAPDPRQRDPVVTLLRVGAVGRDEVGRRLVEQHRPLAQLGRQRADQVAGQVLDPAQRAEHGVAEELGGRRVGTQEARGGGDHHPVDDQHVDRHVVPAEAPAPGPDVPRLAEHPQVVHLRVAAAGAVEQRHEALGVVEERSPDVHSQPHHRRDGHVRPRDSPEPTSFIAARCCGGSWSWKVSPPWSVGV